MLDALKSRNLWPQLIHSRVLSPCLVLAMLSLSPHALASIDEDSFETIEEARDIEKTVIGLIDELRPSVVGLEIAWHEGAWPAIVP